jgi:hypothetical protein
MAYNLVVEIHYGVGSYHSLAQGKGVNCEMEEAILSPANLNAAYRQVLHNKGTDGTDGMEASELKDYFQKHKTTILQTVKSGTY